MKMFFLIFSIVHFALSEASNDYFILLKKEYLPRKDECIWFYQEMSVDECNNLCQSVIDAKVYSLDHMLAHLDFYKLVTSTESKFLKYKKKENVEAHCVTTRNNEIRNTYVTYSESSEQKSLSCKVKKIYFHISQKRDHDSYILTVSSELENIDKEYMDIISHFTAEKPLGQILRYSTTTVFHKNVTSLLGESSNYIPSKMLEKDSTPPFSGDSSCYNSTCVVNSNAVKEFKKHVEKFKKKQLKANLRKYYKYINKIFGTRRTKCSLKYIDTAILYLKLYI